MPVAIMANAKRRAPFYTPVTVDRDPCGCIAAAPFVTSQCSYATNRLSDPIKSRFECAAYADYRDCRYDECG